MEFGKKIWFAAILGALTALCGYLILEGIHALVQGARADTSLAHHYYSKWFVDRVVPLLDPRDPTTRMVTHVAQIEELLEFLEADGVGVGNSPFRRLKNSRTRVNREEDGCRVQKPNLHKTMTYIRSNLFNPFDQMTAFYDADQTLSPEVERFLDRYGFRRIRHSTNRYGERVTLPRVEAAAKVLVAGDSVANGVMLNDDETLASRLQASDPERQYVNLGVSGAAAADVVCALEKAAERYHGQIRELIYVFSENDFAAPGPYAEPDDLIAWLADFQARETIERVVLLYVPYIYNSVPEITRIRGHSHRNFPTPRAEKRRLLSLADAAGFGVIDFIDVANEQRERAASQFAPLALYLDHSHLSRLGVELLLPRFAAAR